MSVIMIVIWVWIILNGALWASVLAIEIRARIINRKSYKIEQNEKKKDLH